MRGSPVVRRGRLERADLGVLYDPTRVVGRLTRRPILRCECGHGSDHAGVDEVPCARVDQGRMSRASIAQPLQGAAAACLSAASGNCPQAANPGCPLADTSSLSVVVGCETTRIQTTFGAPDRCRWSGVRRWSGQGLVLLPASREGSSRMPLRAYPQGQSRHGNPAQFIPHGRGRGADRAGVTHPMLRMWDHVVESHHRRPPEKCSAPGDLEQPMAGPRQALPPSPNSAAVLSSAERAAAKGVEVGGEGVAVVAGGGLAGAAEAPAVVCDHAVAGVEQGGQLLSQEAPLSGYPWMRTTGWPEPWSS